MCSSNLVIRFRKCASGSHSTIVAVDANGHQILCEHTVAFNGDPATPKICLSSPDRSKWIMSYQGAYVGTLEYVIESPNGSTSTRRVAVKNAGSNTMQLDDFFLSGHRALPNVNCPDCTCACRGYGLSRQLLMGTVQNIAGAPRLDDWELPLRLRVPAEGWLPDEYPGDSPPVDERVYCLHEHYHLVEGVWVLQGTENLYVDNNLRCYGPIGPPPETGYDDPDFTLAWSCDSCQAGGPYWATLISVQCDPLVIVLEFDFETDPERCQTVGGIKDCEWCFALEDEPAGDPIRRHFRVTVTE